MTFPRNITDRNVEYPGRRKLIQVAPNVFDVTREEGIITDEGTIINKAYLQPIEDELGDLSNRTLNNGKGIATNSSVIDELLVNAGIETKIAPTSGKFYDYPGASGALSQGSIDFGKTFSSVINTGTNLVLMTALQNAKDNSVPVVLSDCFVVGDEVTLQNDLIKETFKITDVNDSLSILTLNANIVGTFSNGANVYRSNIITDGNVFKFGGFTSEKVIDATGLEQIISSGYTTDQNARPIILDNGDIVALVYDSQNTDLKWYIRDAETSIWSLLGVKDFIATGGFSMVTDGVNIFTLANRTGITSNVHYKFLASNGNGGDIALLPSYVLTNPDTSQTDFGKCSLTIDENNPLKLKGVSSTKNATYPNSFNIRYYESNDGGVTWDNPIQLSTQNQTTRDFLSPTIIIKSDGNPIIIHSYNATSFLQAIYCFVYDGTNWNNERTNLIYSGGSSFIQSNPTADVLSDGTIIVAWDGTDALESSTRNIRFSYSLNDALNWSPMEKLTNQTGTLLHQEQASITRNSDDDIFIVFKGYSNIDTRRKLKILKRTNGVWSTSIIGFDGTNIEHPTSCNNFRNFPNPITIFESIQTSDVKFYGEFILGSETELTNIDVRMNIRPLQGISDIGAYMNVTNNVNGVDGEVSIVDSVATESYIDLIDTRYAINGTDDEVASLLNTVVTAQEKVTLKYNITRLLITDVVGITSILGGVA